MPSNRERHKTVVDTTCSQNKGFKDNNIDEVSEYELQVSIGDMTMHMIGYI